MLCRPPPPQPFVAHYLAKWTQAQLPKPTDRNADRIREWIQAVYETKRFFDADRAYAPPEERLATHTTSKSEVRARAGGGAAASLWCGESCVPEGPTS